MGVNDHEKLSNITPKLSSNVWLVESMLSQISPMITSVKALFLYFNLCRSVMLDSFGVMLDSFSWSFTPISFLTDL
jgi:hypothetical protein